MKLSHRQRLALTYLAIIMFLSLLFSAVFYQQATREAGIGFRRQERQWRNNYLSVPPDFDRIREENIENFRHQVLIRLFLLNILMLSVGGALSYFLAQKSLEPLEQALEAQSRFASDAAHELRTPLTAIKTETEIALRDKNLKLTGSKQVLKSNLEEVAKLQVLTEALLRLAKNNHIEKQNWTEVGAHEIIERAYDQVSLKADAAKIKFELPKASSYKVFGDADQLSQMLVTLFDNAINYSPASSKVKVLTSQQESELVIRVIDKGVGIAESDLSHIFERFYRADKSRHKSKGQGFGLGLSVAQTIAEAHNGKISATSVLGQGSTFKVTLPVVS